MLGGGELKPPKRVFQENENQTMHLNTAHYSYVVNNQLTFSQVSGDLRFQEIK